MERGYCNNRYVRTPRWGVCRRALDENRELGKVCHFKRRIFYTRMCSIAIVPLDLIRYKNLYHNGPLRTFIRQYSLARLDQPARRTNFSIAKWKGD